MSICKREPTAGRKHRTDGDHLRGLFDMPSTAGERNKRQIYGEQLKEEEAGTARVPVMGQSTT